MKRVLAVLMTASLTMAACDGGVSQSISSPSTTVQPTSSATDNTGFAVGGVVQSIEKPMRAVGGARVEVMQGPNIGKFAVTDDTGAFAIFGLTPGRVTIQVSKTGYQAWASKDFDVESDTKIAVELFPAPPRILQESLPQDDATTVIGRGRHHTSMRV